MMSNPNAQLDRLLHLESNRLRIKIIKGEERVQNITLQEIESLMLQKEEEVAIARKRNTDLQNLVKTAETQTVDWAKEATYNEAVAADLGHRLRRARAGADDSASSGERSAGFMDCKRCNAGLRCLVFGPCKHLCCCINCEPVLKHCPVCGAEKKEVFRVSFSL